MTLTAERSYALAPRALLDVLLDPAFLDARGARFGGTGPAVVGHEGDEIVVRFPRVLPLDDIPGPLRGFAGGGRLVQVDRWYAVSDERCAARWTTESAMPGALRGTYEITPAGDGSRYVVTATATVHVPLVGGRIAKEVEAHAARLVDNELGFLSGWLAR